MRQKQRFDAKTLAAIRRNSLLHLRAGSRPHRFIGIWVVVVAGRVFVRSWSLKRRSWYRTFLKEPHGIVKIGNRQIPVRSLNIRGERLQDAVDRAYLKKYGTGWSLGYAQDLCRAKSRATTTELRPLS